MPKVKFEVAVREFLAYRQARNLSKNTLGQDRAVLGHAVRLVGGLYVENITSNHVTQIFTHASKTRAPRTLASVNYPVFKKFFEWSAGNKYLPRWSNPMDGWDPPKWSQTERRRVHVSKFPALMNAATHPRDRMLIAMGLYTLARSGEIATVRIGHVDLDDRTIFMTIHKSRRVDRMPIAPELDTELRKYLEWYSGQVGPLDPMWYLVPARTRPKIRGDVDETTKLQPERLFGRPGTAACRALNAIGFPTRDLDGKPLNEGMHTLRRSGARARFDALREQGYDRALIQVRDLLHHKSSLMTERYLGLDVDIVARNESVWSKPFYPSLVDKNVVSLDERREAHGNA